MLEKDEIRPLVIMTSKKYVTESSRWHQMLEEFNNERFQTFIETKRT